MSLLQEIKDRVTDAVLRDKIVRQIEIQNETINNFESLHRSQKVLILQLQEELRALKQESNTKQPQQKIYEGLIIDDELEKVLLILSKHEGQRVMAHAIASEMGVSLTRAKGLLQKLDNAEYVYTPLILGGGEQGYGLLSKGREYLISKDLV